MDSISVNIKGLEDVRNRFKGLEKKIAEDVDETLNTNIKDIERSAITYATERAFDEGNLAGSIHADDTKFLEKKITVNANYAAFVEFGTGKYASEYVNSLPDTWKQFAAQYKGQKGGTFDDFIRAMVGWVHRHSKFGENAVTGTFSVKTHRRTGSNSTREKQDRQAAYLIVRKILRDGVHAHPFLFPAFRDQESIILKNVEDILNGL